MEYVPVMQELTLISMKPMVFGNSYNWKHWLFKWQFPKVYLQNCYEVFSLPLPFGIRYRLTHSSAAEAFDGIVLAFGLRNQSFSVLDSECCIDTV